MDQLWLLFLVPLAWALGEALSMTAYCRQLRRNREFEQQYNERLIEAWTKRAQE